MIFQKQDEEQKAVLGSYINRLKVLKLQHA